MDSLKDLTHGKRVDVLIGWYDINRFLAVARKVSPEEVLDLIVKIGAMVDRCVSGSGGLIIKYVGDAALFVYPEGLVDRAVDALLALKSEMEGFFSQKGYGNTVTFSLHFGEVIVGKIPPFGTWDIFGEAVNIAFSLDRGPYRAQFVITPQAFRKLSPATRKLFHKHTPPIVYLSDRSSAAPRA